MGRGLAENPPPLLPTPLGLDQEIAFLPGENMSTPLTQLMAELKDLAKPLASPKLVNLSELSSPETFSRSG